MTRPREWFGKSRCGWCITGDHRNCLIAMETNSPLSRGRPGDTEQFRNKRWGNPMPLLWRCGCWCEWSGKLKCVICQRVGVDVDRGSHCIDVESCKAARARKKYRPLLERGKVT